MAAAQHDGTAQLHVLVVGSPTEGFTFYGPYHSAEDVIEVGEDIQEDWWVGELHTWEGD